VLRYCSRAMGVYLRIVMAEPPTGGDASRTVVVFSLGWLFNFNFLFHFSF
jgi:hypothetical protein